MKYLIIDIETDGLDPTKIWVAVTKDHQTNEIRVWDRPDIFQVEEFCEYINSFTLVGHNAISFDIPAINKLCNTDVSFHACLDTFVLSRLSNSWHHSSHSLAAWGERLGFPKGEFNDWSKLSQEMRDYCVQDVEVTHKLFKLLLPFIQDPKNRLAIKNEMQSQVVCHEMQQNGFWFNIKKAQELKETIQKEADELFEQLQIDFPPKSIEVKSVVPIATKSGSIHSKDFRWLEGKPEDEGYSVGSEFSLIDWKEFNPRSSKDRIDVLNALGWDPVEKTKGHIQAIRDNDQEKLEKFKVYGWKLTEDNLKTLPKSAPKSAHTLVRWILLDRRLSTLQEWFDAYNAETHRIHGKINSIGTWTHRASHTAPNTGNIARSSSEFGAEMRALWGVPSNRGQVGVDASGIQLRILAHYLDNPKFTKAVTEGREEDGTDIHTVNQRALGDICKTRNHSKTFIYAWLLGAGVAKVASILECKPGQAGAAVDDFISRTEGLGKLKREKIPEDAKRGYFIGLDGRKVLIDSEYKMLAGYLQNGEAVIMKHACRLWYNRLLKEGVDFKLVNWVHDEWQTEVPRDKELAEYVRDVQIASIVRTGKELGLKCPLDGGGKLGFNWLQTH